MNTGKIAVYEVKYEKGKENETIQYLSARTRFNPELKYFVVLKNKYEADKEHINKIIKSKNYKSKINLYDGIIEL